MGVTVIVGTVKGGFVLRSQDRAAWTVDEPLFKGWKVTASTRAPDGTWYLGTASYVYGAAIQRSDDLKEWSQVEDGPAYPKGGDRKMNQIWTLAPAAGALWAGVDEAGLFRSGDGAAWEPIPGLNDHPTRRKWFPGNGGLCLHHVSADPADPQRMWVGISAVGVFRTEDGGATWNPRNEGVPRVIEDDEFAEIGYCVHGLAHDPDDANVIYRQDHAGMFRSRDGGDSWERTENGLPSWFGFPIELDRRTRRLYSVPLETDEYRIPCDGCFRVFTSADGADSWQAAGEGLPASHAYMGVLRGALSLDHQDPCGVYVGTTAGTVHVSADGGNAWTTLPYTFPRILSVDAYPDDA
jgi:photosystem II stability/assembly factor-like uncharacterized protein